MTAIVFDTLAFSERLQDAGFTPEQAKGQAHAMRKLLDNQIATRHDIQALDASMATRFAETKTELIKWYMAAMLATTGLVAGLVKFVH